MRIFTSLLALSLALGACDPTLDDSIAEGGNAPEPRAVIDGTIAYQCPRPYCELGADGERHFVGRFILFLFREDDPPPPQGTATFPVSALYVLPEDVFSAPEDCMPAEPSAEDLALTIDRFGEFVWPSIPLSTDFDEDGSPLPVRYFAAGNYDRQDDLRPSITVAGTSNVGDVAGAGLAPIEIGHESDFPNGQRIQGLAVGFQPEVNTSPPMFRLAPGTPPLSSEAPLPISFDADELEQMVYDANPVQIEHISGDDRERYREPLAVAGVDISYDPLNYAWYVRDVDADMDGTTDVHPVLGQAAMVPWRTPVVLMQRARTVAEQLAGIPDVAIIANARGGKEVRSPQLDLLVPAAAAVLLGNSPECQIPYLAPSNPVFAFTFVPTVCHELPTGRYTINLLHGVAGGIPQSGLPPEESDTGLGLMGGIFPSQTWSIPNELGPPDTRYNPLSVNHVDPDGVSASDPESITIPEQGPEGRYWVTDPDPSNESTCTQAFDPNVMALVDIRFQDVPEQCCGGIQHLCGIPLCEAYDVGDGRMIREATELDTNGLPTCVPFEMPPTCCEG